MRCPRLRRARKLSGAGIFKIIVARARALGRDQSLPPSDTLFASFHCRAVIRSLSGKADIERQQKRAESVENDPLRKSSIDSCWGTTLLPSPVVVFGTQSGAT